MSAADATRRGGGLALVVAALVTVVAGILMMSLVVMGVSRPEPPTFAPTAREPRPAIGRIGPVRFTVDATAPDRWRFFSFRYGTIFESPGPLEWDLAFRRFQIIVNGGDGFAGVGGAVALEGVQFPPDSPLPASGFVANEVDGDTINPVFESWYRYSYFTHLLTPTNAVYAVRTADGRRATLRFDGYYCPGAVPGCVTFTYYFDAGDGLAPGGQITGE